MILLEFSMAPADQGESMSHAVAEIIDIIDRSGIPYRLNPMGTVIEGEWDDVFALVQRCYTHMRQTSRRISISIKVDAREGATGRLEGKIASVEAKCGRKLCH